MRLPFPGRASESSLRVARDLAAAAPTPTSGRSPASTTPGVRQPLLNQTGQTAFTSSPVRVASARPFPERWGFSSVADLPHVSEFEVKVEQHESGWAVVTFGDGVRSVISHHPDKAAADYAAEQLQRTATRHVGAAERVAPDPAKYPGDQVQ